MSNDFIVQHALRNVWCTPAQDYQFALEPARMTPRHGRMRTAKVLWSEFALPDPTSRWHVYQIGGIHPAAFNLFPKCMRWVSFQEAANTNQMVANVYGTNGFEFPLFDTYYRYTENNNLLMAVKINAKIRVDLNADPAYLRVYSNAFFNSTRSNPLVPPKIETTGMRIEVNADKTTMVAKHASYAGMPGYAYFKINGVYHNTATTADIAVGDYVEVIHDQSIYAVKRFLIGELPVFESTLDSKRKYLLHYAGNINRIDFQDDVDVYITQKVGSTQQFRGVYYHKNDVAAMRQVTHKDYSIDVTYVKRATESIEKFQPTPVTLEPNLMYVDVLIRNAGWDRPLTFENNRIHELYKMSEENIMKAFFGIDATVPYWLPATLEASMHTFIMRSKCSAITKQVVEDGYGYNALTKYTADTPTVVTVTGNARTIEVPYRHQFGCTAYEYDENGILIDWHHHLVGQVYTAHSQDCHYVELIAGLGGEILDEVYNARITPWKDRHSYRVYLSQAVADVANNAWVDVTGDTTKYRRSDDGLFIWLGTNPTDYPLLRSDARFLAKDLELTMQEGELSFDITHLQNRGITLSNWKMQIPLGQMDLIINGKSGIRGLDYIVDFPKVHVISKNLLAYPLATAKQKFHLRFVGHCTPDKQMLPEGDIGFIEHGVMSNNNRFDIRDDKVLRIVVGGALKHRDDLIFSEFHSGVSTINPLNGAPYMVKDIYVPIKQHSVSDTLTLWNKAKVIDKVVSNYLTKKIPQPPRNAPSAIVDRYMLFSPFINKLIIDLKYNRLRLPQQPGGFKRQQVAEICIPYEHLLKFDPTQDENFQDERYVVIHPIGMNAVISLPHNEYMFIQAVVNNYCKNRLTLSPSVVVQ